MSHLHLQKLMINREKIQKIFFDKTNIMIYNAELLLEALSHKSFSGESFYQRLEFFGDGILSFFSSYYVYNNYPNADEGELSKIKSTIVNRENLAFVFDKLNIQDIIFINTKSFKDKIPESIKEDIIESLLATIYIDRGFDIAMDFFNLIIKYSKKMSDLFFAKNRLQEFSLDKYKILPKFVVEEKDNIFFCKIYVNNKYITSAKGETKKECEKKVALKALEIIEKENK